MKLVRIFKVFCIIFAVMIFSLPFCYAVWGGLAGDTRSRDLDFSTGNFWGDVVDDPLDRLPDDVPPVLEGHLNDIQQSGGLSDQDLCGVVDTVVAILDYIGKLNLTSDVLVGSDVEDLFNRNPNVENNDFLVYVNEENGVSEIIVIHIDPNSGFVVDSVDSLFYALERPWTGINIASSLWLSGNMYTTYHSPVEYEGKYFLMNFDGPSGTPPTLDRNTWFELVGNFEYTAENARHCQNIIVSANGRHFRATQTVWNVSPLTQGWNPWQEIFEWQNGQNYLEGTFVKTVEGGQTRFWMALSSTGVVPNESNARLGFWREFSNGWLGKNGDNDVKSHYFEHNTYSAGAVVVYGISPRMNYRYFEAVGDVPSDCPPLYYDSQNVLHINSQYWKVY